MWHTLIKHRKWHSLLAYLAGSLSLLTLGIFIALGQARLTRAEETNPNSAPIGEDAHQPNPFPMTAAMTDTVQLVLDQYLGDQPMVALTKSDQELTPLTSVVNLYLPISMSAQAQSQPTPTPRPHPTQHGDIAVTIWPEPSIHVMRGARLTYELRIRNYDQGQAKGVRATLPYDQRQMRRALKSRGSRG